MANVRQSIVDALQARLQTITTDNGYSTTIANVDVWKTVAYEQHNLPSIEIRDVDAVLSQEGISSGRIDHQLPFELAVSFVGDESPESARDIIADILRAIGTDETFGELAYKTEPNGVGLYANSLNTELAQGQVEITVYYRTSAWDM
jgi:hypothetical protein